MGRVGGGDSGGSGGRIGGGGSSTSKPDHSLWGKFKRNVLGNSVVKGAMSPFTDVLTGLDYASAAGAATALEVGGLVGHALHIKDPNLRPEYDNGFQWSDIWKHTVERKHANDYYDLGKANPVTRFTTNLFLDTISDPTTYLTAGAGKLAGIGSKAASERLALAAADEALPAATRAAAAEHSTQLLEKGGLFSYKGAGSAEKLADLNTTWEKVTGNPLWKREPGLGFTLPGSKGAVHVKVLPWRPTAAIAAPLRGASAVGHAVAFGSLVKHLDEGRDFRHVLRRAARDPNVPVAERATLASTALAMDAAEGARAGIFDGTLRDAYEGMGKGVSKVDAAKQLAARKGPMYDALVHATEKAGESVRTAAEAAGVAAVNWDAKTLVDDALKGISEDALRKTPHAVPQQVWNKLGATYEKTILAHELITKGVGTEHELARAAFERVDKLSARVRNLERTAAREAQPAEAVAATLADTQNARKALDAAQQSRVLASHQKEARTLKGRARADFLRRKGHASLGDLRDKLAQARSKAIAYKRTGGQTTQEAVGAIKARRYAPPGYTQSPRKGYVRLYRGAAKGADVRGGEAIGGDLANTAGQWFTDSPEGARLVAGSRARQAGTEPTLHYIDIKAEDAAAHFIDHNLTGAEHVLPPEVAAKAKSMPFDPQIVADRTARAIARADPFDHAFVARYAQNVTKAKEVLDGLASKLQRQLEILDGTRAGKAATTVESQRALLARAEENARLFSDNRINQLLPQHMKREFENFGIARVPDHIAQGLATAMRDTPKELTGIGRFISSMTGRWKGAALLSPGFHVRNLYSAVWMNSLAGAPLAIQEEAMRHVFAYRHGGEVDDVTRGWLDWFHAHGGFGGQGEEISRELAGKRARLGAGFTTKGMNWVERNVRFALFYDGMKRGLTEGQAMNRVYKFHFNYAQAAKGQYDKIANRYIPFWTWMSRNFALQSEMIFRKPMLYARTQHVMQNLQASGAAEHLPDWLARSGGVQVTGNDQGGLAFAPQLPVYQAEQILPLGSGESGQLTIPIAENLNPLLSTPLQSVFGHKLSDPEYKMTGEQIDRQWIGLVPPLSRLGGLGVPLVPGYSGKTAKDWTTWARLFGVPSYRLTAKQLEQAKKAAEGYYAPENSITIHKGSRSGGAPSSGHNGRVGG